MGTHRNRKHPQLWTARDKRIILRTAAFYSVGFLSPPLEGLKVLLDLVPVNTTRIFQRDREVGAAAINFIRYIIIEESS